MEDLAVNLNKTIKKTINQKYLFSESFLGTVKLSVIAQMSRINPTNRQMQHKTTSGHFSNTNSFNFR